MKKLKFKSSNDDLLNNPNHAVHVQSSFREFSNPVNVRSPVSKDPSRLRQFLDKTKAFFIWAFSNRPWWFWGIFIFIVLVLLLVIIIAILYSVWYVGMPDFMVTSVIPSNGEKGIHISQTPTGSWKVTIDIIVNVIVTNPNKISLTFDNVVVSIYNWIIDTSLMAQNRLGTITVGAEGQLPLSIPFTITFDLGADPKGLVGKDFIDSCTIAKGDSIPKKQVNVLLKLNEDIRITDLIRITGPTITSIPGFDCPLHIKQVFSLGNGISIDISKVNWGSLAQGQLSVSEGGILFSK